MSVACIHCPLDGVPQLTILPNVALFLFYIRLAPLYQFEVCFLLVLRWARVNVDVSTAGHR